MWMADVVHEAGVVGRLGQGDAAQPLSALDPGRLRHDGAQHHAERAGLMRVEEGRAGIEAVEADGRGRHVQDLAEGAVDIVGAQHARARRPGTFDAVLGRVETLGGQRRRALQHLARTEVAGTVLDEAGVDAAVAPAHRVEAVGE